MEEYLNLNPMNHNEWLVNHKVSKSEDTKLELRLGLGPPGVTHGTKRAFQHTAKTRIGEKESWSSENQCRESSFFENLPMTEDFSQPRMTAVQFPDRKPCSTSLATVDEDTTTNNTSNKRIAYSPVVGWPPIRSSRKNLITNTTLSKPASESRNEKEKISGGKPENCNTHHHHQLFVKINMEGIPIGRKVNLSAYNSYEQLSLAIDDLFSGLLAAAQTDSSAIQNENKIEELAKADTCSSLAGSGEYTLIYEDDEGDRILVGDVPWHMFVSTAKRLHVLKSSELSTLRICSSNVKEKDTS